MLFAEADFVAVGTLITTVVLAGLTGWYVLLTYRLLRAQTDPCVIVYVRADESRPTIILVIVENVGKSAAKDVKFEFSQPFFRAFGATPESASEPETMSNGPFVYGIPLLAPGEIRKCLGTVFWHQKSIGKQGYLRDVYVYACWEAKTIFSLETSSNRVLSRNKIVRPSRRR